MTTRFVVFPVHGRRWSFNTSMRPAGAPGADEGALTFKGLLRRITANDQGLSAKTELLTHFVSDKMQQKWIALEKAPVGSIRHRVYSLGQRLLARVEPSEMFLKSIPKETTKVEIVFPLSLNPRLVRRRLRQVATSGAIYHRRYMYGSVALLPFTALFGVLPLPNIPLFWNLFRAHAHWRALQGSERLLLLVSDSSNSWNMIAVPNNKMADVDTNNTEGGCNIARPSCPWVLRPCKKLENIVPSEDKSGALSDLTISAICQAYNLDSSQVLKWRDYKKM
eukprot:Gb_37507 [translate_table: standard]